MRPDRPVLLVWGVGRRVGGTETRMAEVVAHWSAQGRRVVSVMLTAETASPLRALLEASGSEVVQTRDVRRLESLVSELDPPRVIAFGLRASLVCRALHLFARVRRHRWPLTFDARNGLEALRGRGAWLLDRSTQRLVDAYVTNSVAAASVLASHGIARGRVRVLPSALGEGWQHTGAARAPRRPATVAMVGNARPEKQHRLGLELFARLHEDARLAVYTDDASELRRHWAGLAEGSSGTVVFREGCTVGPAELLETAVVLHPSSHESAPRCLMEARAAGCHVVAFDVGDTRRIVGHGGELAAPGDADALFQALERAVRASALGTLEHAASQFPSVSEYAEAWDVMGGAR